MSDSFLGEIRPVAFAYAPKGWALCNGQLLPINQNVALFSLLGITYGGDGRNNFALPNLQGCSPLGQGQGQGLTNRLLGATGGSTTQTLTSQQMPLHNHGVNGDNGLATSSVATGNLPGRAAARSGRYYGPGTSPVAMGPNAVGVAGSGQPHNNQQPYLVLNFIISLQGIFPQRP